MDNQANQGKNFCSKCGTTLAPNSVFCSSCGTPVPKQSVAQPQQTAFCKHCGSKYSVGTKFCPKCGNLTQGSAPVKQQQNSVPNKEEQTKRVYDQAISLLGGRRFDQAFQLFVSLGEYGDARQKAKECAIAIENAKKEQLYATSVACLLAKDVDEADLKKAVNNLRLLGDYKDSKAKIAQAEEYLEIINKEKLAAEEAERLRQAQAKKRKKNIALFAAACFCIVAISVAGIVFANVPFNVTYDLSGGILQQDNPATYNMLTDDILLNNPIKVGYTFVGWSEADNNDPQVDRVIKRWSFGNKSYIANWKANEYTITLNVNGGTGINNTLNVSYDSEYVLPTPTRKGYTFNGWYSGSTLVTGGMWNKTSDVTLNAKWTANQYNVNFSDVTTKEYAVVTFDYNCNEYAYYNYDEYLYDGEFLYIPSEPSRYGYVFTGWYTDSQCTARYNFTGTINDDMTLYAGWMPMNTDYAYDFVEISNPAYYDSSYYEYDISTRYTSSTSPKHIYLVANETGKHKIHYRNSSSSSRYYLEIYNITKNTAILDSTVVSSNYYNDVAFECDAGDVVEISLYRYSTSSSSYYSYAYFYFTGFEYEDASAYADISGLVYSEGSDWYSEQISFDEEVTLPVLKRPGYRFLGWFNGNTKVESGPWSIDSNVTLTPKWEEIVYYDVTLNDSMLLPNKINVTFNYNYLGSTDYKVELSNGQTLDYPTIPVRSGYVFVGWYIDNTCTTPYTFSGKITEDITLYAKWDTVTVTNDYYYPWNVENGNLVSTNKLDGTSSEYTIFAPSTITVSFEYATSSESSWDELYIMVNDYVIQTCSGVTDSYYYSVTLNEGEYLTFRYSKDGSFSSGDDCAYIYNLTISSQSYISSSATAQCSDRVGLVYDDGSTHTLRAGYGEEFTLPEITRPGYTFLGWYYGDTKVESGVWNIPGNATLTPRWKQ